MAAAKSDFVNVRLSDAGRAFAGEHGIVRIANAHMNYAFTDDKQQRVLTSEWAKVLSTVVFEGKSVFEIVADQAQQPAAVGTHEETHDAAPEL